VGEHKDRMLRGELYMATDDPDLAADNARCERLLARFNATTVDDLDERQALLQALFGRVGEGTVIRPPLRCDYGIHTSIGARCFANFGLVILDTAPVSIGDDVQIASNVQLLAATHPLDPELRATGLELARPVSVGDGAWLGAGVIVCPGVSVGPGTVVGAGAVVARDLPPRVLAVGNPARVVRPLDGPRGA
jgi:maltose O-acetyltransferase